MGKKYAAGKFMQAAIDEIDFSCELHSLGSANRGSLVASPALTSSASKFESSSPLELIHISRIVSESIADVQKHFLGVVMLTRHERPSFHVIHLATGREMREVNHLIVSSLGQIKLVS